MSRNVRLPSSSSNIIIGQTDFININDHNIILNDKNHRPTARRLLNVILQGFHPAPNSEGGHMLDFLWLRDVLMDIGRPVLSSTLLLFFLTLHSHNSKVRYHMGNMKATEVPMNDSLVLVMFGPDDPALFQRARIAGSRNVGAFHLGDSMLDQSREFYADCDYVFRHYFDARVLTDPKVHFINLGTKSGLGTPPSSSLQRASQRHIACNFIGSTLSVASSVPLAPGSH